MIEHNKLEKIDNCTNEHPNTIPIIYGIDAIHGANYVQNNFVSSRDRISATWDTSIVSQ